MSRVLGTLVSDAEIRIPRVNLLLWNYRVQPTHRVYKDIQGLNIDTMIFI